MKHENLVVIESYAAETAANLKAVVEQAKFYFKVNTDKKLETKIHKGNCTLSYKDGIFSLEIDKP